MLYVFVEGIDDERFFKNYFMGISCQIVQYSKMPKKDLTNYIRAIGYMKDADYIIITDADGAEIEDKKKSFTANHPICDENKTYISQWEIESWYLAGYSQEEGAKNKVKYLYCTDGISKEKFNDMIPKKMDAISFKLEILKTFDKVLASQRNRSFRIFDLALNKASLAV